MRPTVLVRASILALACATLGAPRSFARGPRPAGRVQPPRVQQRLVLVSDLVGQTWTLGEHRVLVHDLALARTPDGVTLALRADLELENGTRFVNEPPADQVPAGTIPVHALDEAFPSEDPRLWWADASGEIRVASMNAVGPAAVGRFGQVTLDPGMTCTVSLGIICQPSGCSRCRVFPNPCECGDHEGMGPPTAPCPMGIEWTRCVGECPAGKTCIGGGASGCRCDG